MMIRTYLKLTVPSLALMLAMSAAGQTPAPTSPPQSRAGLQAEAPQARAAAESWLGAMDTGNSSTAFRALSPATTAVTDQQKWSQAIAEKRSKFGEPKWLSSVTSTLAVTCSNMIWSNAEI